MSEASVCCLGGDAGGAGVAVDVDVDVVVAVAAVAVEAVVEVVAVAEMAGADVVVAAAHCSVFQPAVLVDDCSVSGLGAVGKSAR